MMDNSNRNLRDPRPGAGDPAEHAEEKTAREREQSRSLFFASVKARLQPALDSLFRAEDWISFRALGRLMDSGVLSRLTPGVWAALLSGAVLLLLALFGELSALLRPAGIWGVCLSLTGTLICVLLPALLGLASPCRPALRRRPLNAEQRLSLAAAGVCLICPVSLLADITTAVLARFGISAAAQAASAPDFSLFLPMLLVSGIAAPLCEELFFRGVLGGLLRSRGEGFAAAASALVFAAAHGMEQFAVHALLGLLLYAVLWRTDSLVSAVMVHSLYNISILLLAFTGLSGLFSGLSLVSCAVRMAGCAAFAAALLRLWRARRPAMPAKKPKRLRLNRREWGMAAAAAALLILSQIIAGVMKG